MFAIQCEGTVMGVEESLKPPDSIPDFMLRRAKSSLIGAIVALLPPPIAEAKILPNSRINPAIILTKAKECMQTPSIQDHFLAENMVIHATSHNLDNISKFFEGQMRIR